MTYVYAVLAFAGWMLATWAWVVLDANVSPWPVGMQPARFTRRGPYKWLAHPMYLGSLFMVAGFAGIAAGFWNFLAAFTVTELLLREWAHRETGYPRESIFRRRK